MRRCGAFDDHRYRLRKNIVAKQWSWRRSTSMPRCQMQKRRTCHEPACRGLLALPERKLNQRLVRMWRIHPMGDDEIDVDGYVMKPEVRGTSRDQRALYYEQWMVKVRMLDSGRTFQVSADRAKWEKLRENDRVRVRHRTGKYTGTVWAAEIE
jgi:hypothetical protein